MSYDAAVARIAFLQGAITTPQARPVAAPTIGTETKFANALGTATAGGQAGMIGQGAGVGQAAPVGAGGGGGVVGAAASQIGVTEEPPGSNDSPRIASYRQAVAGNPGPGPWCAYFTSWAAKQSGQPLGNNGEGFGSVDALYSWAQGAGRAVPAGSGAPKPGDLVVWDEHIGVVESVLPGGKIQTIEGNSSDRVARRTRDTSGVVGYVRMS